MAGAGEGRGWALLIPGDPAKHVCDLILRSGQVEVHAGDDAGAARTWEEYDPLRSAGEVVDGLIAAGVGADREDVERVVDERYTTVDPWPFGALTRS